MCIFIVNKKHKLDLCVSAEHIFQERFYSIRNLIYVVFLTPNKITLFLQILLLLMELRKEVKSQFFFSTQFLRFYRPRLSTWKSISSEQAS